MSPAVYWAPPIADAVIYRNCVDAASDYEFLLCSELLRPPTA